MRTNLVALYGTLRRGQPPHRRLGLDRQLGYLGPCTIPGTLHDFGDWPGLYEGDGEVAAELFRLANPELLARLDAYEGCSPARPAAGLFVRRLVTLAEPRMTRAYVYFCNRDPAGVPLIESGDWVRHCASRRRLRA